MRIRTMRPEDWDKVAQIYGAGIAAENATFERRCPEYAAWDRAHLAACRLVCEREGEAVGFVVLSATSSRAVFAGVAEVSIYVSPQAKHCGVGRALLEAEIEASEEAGIWTLQSGVFPENEASLALHAACGFRVVGRRERIGRFRDGRWRDILLLERRSESVGR